MYDELTMALRTCVDKDKDCSECPYYERCVNNTSGKLAAMVDAADAIEELSKRVPPVPHGRLIDADALLDDLLFPSKQFEQGMRELIGDAPTVIPAEDTLKEATND